MNITPISKNDFEQMFAIMQEAFPAAEYRPKKKQFELLDNDKYSLSVLKEDGVISAFIAVWELDGFVFAEHFAVSKQKRNQGLGSSFLEAYLKTLSLPLVLEVENLNDSLSLRRIEFYKRLGFLLTDICYDQPNFQKCAKTIPLRIMYFPNNKELDITRVKDEIFKKIYKKGCEELK